MKLRACRPFERSVLTTLGNLDVCQDRGVYRMAVNDTVLTAEVRRVQPDGRVLSGHLRLYPSGSVYLFMDKGCGRNGKADMNGGNTELFDLLMDRLRPVAKTAPAIAGKPPVQLSLFGANR